MWTTALCAGASPAPKLTVSRRSRYMSAQPPMIAVAPSAASSAARLTKSLRRIVRSLAHVEDMAGLDRPAVGAALELARQPRRDLGLAEPEEFRIGRGPR